MEGGREGWRESGEEEREGEREGKEGGLVMSAGELSPCAGRRWSH